MSALSKIMIDATGALAIVVMGVVVIVAVFLLSMSRHKKTYATITRLVDLALGGRADEARIQARNESSELAPLLDALGGELVTPAKRPIVKDLLAAAVMPLPVIALGLYGWAQTRSAGEAKVTIAAAILIGLAVLLPLTSAGAYAIFSLARHTSRLVRGSCVTLLARSVKATVDAETVEALRRGANVRDPRVE